MFLKRIHSYPRTVAFRMTVWFTGLFGVLSVCTFVLVYIVLTASLNRQFDQELLADTIEFTTLYQKNGLAALREEFDREAESDGVSKVYFRIISPQGSVLAHSNLKAWGGLTKADVHNLAGPVWHSSRQMIHGEPVATRNILSPTPSGVVFEIGEVLEDKKDITEQFLAISLAAVGLMVVIGGIVGWRMARMAMNGVNRVTQTAFAIGDGNMEQRVPVDSADGKEVVELAQAFNLMLEHIDKLIRQLRTISDNIAHDLRSPITRIRGVAEMALSGTRDESERREAYGVIIEEADRLVLMINTMLNIARVETDQSQMHREMLDLGQLVAEACELFQPVADTRGVEVVNEAAHDSIRVIGDRSMLQRVIANLIDNAIKYAPEHGRVIASVSLERGQSVVAVTDNGTGVDPDDLPYIFDRFYRCDRSRSTPGHGLGLTLALAFVRAHGGTINVDNLPGPGCRVEVRLPGLNKP